MLTRSRGRRRVPSLYSLMSGYLPPSDSDVRQAIERIGRIDAAAEAAEQQARVAGEQQFDIRTLAARTRLQRCVNAVIATDSAAEALVAYVRALRAQGQAASGESQSPLRAAAEGLMEDASQESASQGQCGAAELHPGYLRPRVLLPPLDPAKERLLRYRRRQLRTVLFGVIKRPRRRQAQSQQEQQRAAESVQLGSGEPLSAITAETEVPAGARRAPPAAAAAAAAAAAGAAPPMPRLFDPIPIDPRTGRFAALRETIRFPRSSPAAPLAAAVIEVLTGSHRFVSSP